jgi:hypothetical protein
MPPQRTSRREAHSAIRRAASWATRRAAPCLAENPTGAWARQPASPRGAPSPLQLPVARRNPRAAPPRAAPPRAARPPRPRAAARPPRPRAAARPLGPGAAQGHRGCRPDSGPRQRPDCASCRLPVLHPPPADGSSPKVRDSREVRSARLSLPVYQLIHASMSSYLRISTYLCIVVVEDALAHRVDTVSCRQSSALGPLDPRSARAPPSPAPCPSTSCP